MVDFKVQYSPNVKPERVEILRRKVRIISKVKESKYLHR